VDQISSALLFANKAYTTDPDAFDKNVKQELFYLADGQVPWHGPTAKRPNGYPFGTVFTVGSHTLHKNAGRPLMRSNVARVASLVGVTAEAVLD
jgi:hypothetical protein